MSWEPTNPMALMLRENRDRTESEPVRCAVGDRYWRYRDMTDYGTVCLGDEGEGKLPCRAQRIDDMLLGMTRVRRLQERGDRHRLDLRHIGRSLGSYPDVHMARVHGRRARR